MDSGVAGIAVAFLSGIGLEATRRFLTRGDRVQQSKQTTETTQFQQLLQIVEHQTRQITNLEIRIQTLEAREDVLTKQNAEQAGLIINLQGKVEQLTQRLTAVTLERDMYQQQLQKGKS